MYIKSIPLPPESLTDYNAFRTWIVIIEKKPDALKYALAYITAVSNSLCYEHHREDGFAFMSTRISPDSIKKYVAFAQTHNKKMEATTLTPVVTRIAAAADFHAHTIEHYLTRMLLHFCVTERGAHNYISLHAALKMGDLATYSDIRSRMERLQIPFESCSSALELSELARAVALKRDTRKTTMREQHGIKGVKR